MTREKKPTTKTTTGIQVEIQKEVSQLSPSWNNKLISLLIFISAFALYFNTYFNEYALDDGIVITENEYTKKGFSGIADIFSHESFSGVAGISNELAGGRYRPLSIATFAIEYGIFGPKPGLSHLVNALLYGFVCLLLFYFLRQVVFRNNYPAALLATLIFAVHPLHADVVSNIKGRDELLSLLLLIACLQFYFRYVEQKKILQLIAALIAFFLSLLAKENGITFIAVIPLALYFFTERKLKKSLLAAFPFVLVFLAYLFMRLDITGVASGGTKEVMNAPFVLASKEQEIATKIMILGKDLLMLIFPHPLSFDYSYSQVPYVHFSDWKCLLSIFVNGLLIFYAIKLFRKKHLLSFCILFYYITLSIVSNFVFEVGSPFNERFLFQPSIGFAIALAFLLTSLASFKKENSLFKGLAIAISILLIAAGAIRTIVRNPDWKDNDTLFIADAVHAPNSAKTTSFAGVAFLKRGEKEKDSTRRNNYFDTAITYFRRALVIYPDYADAYIDLGDIYVQKGMLDSSKINLMKAKAIYPDNSVLNINLQYLAQQYNALAVKNFEAKNLPAAITAITSSLECMPNNPSALYNLGGYYLNMQNVEKAREVWTKALTLDPNNKTIKEWLDRISVQPPAKN